MKDILIVGFGLAGLSIAKHAEDRKLSFDIITDSSQKSSKIAGGILNPIAVKRMKPVWNVEEFLPYARSYYKSLETRYNCKVFHDKNIEVAIHNTEQENNWYSTYDKPRVQPHIQKNLKNGVNDYVTFSKTGVVKASVVDLKSLFVWAKEYYSRAKQWSNETFDYSALKFKNDCIVFNNQTYRHLIFCEGFGVTRNPFFNDLGIYGNKGDYLILESSQLKYNDILKSKYFLIPLGNDLYKFGATYQRKPLNHKPSDEARLQMVEVLNKMITSTYKIVDQVCGIRPTTKDRKPILGTHRIHRNLHVLNGFGSRGVMTSPLLGRDLLDYIFDGKEIDPQVSIQRIYDQI